MRLIAVAGGFLTVFVSAKNSQLMRRMQRCTKSVSVDHATSSTALYPGSCRRAGMLSPNS